MWNKIKQELDKQGITEYRLAKMTGISPQQLHQIKKRNTKILNGSQSLRLRRH